LPSRIRREHGDERRSGNPPARTSLGALGYARVERDATLVSRLVAVYSTTRNGLRSRAELSVESVVTDYWNYYDESFDWNDTDEHVRPDLGLTRRTFAGLGFSSTEIDGLMNSGYVMFRGTDIIVDRFYGGVLLSSDFKTRIPSRMFRDWLSGPFRSIPVCNAASTREVLDEVTRLRANNSRPLVFRGQTTNYSLARDRPNPYESVQGLGEISLLPSLWRVMRAKAPASFHNFTSLSLLEWSKIIFSQFDLSDIERR
jgi:hypothetical protein